MYLEDIIVSRKLSALKGIALIYVYSNAQISVLGLRKDLLSYAF